MYGFIEFVCKPSIEDNIVWVVEVYYIEGYIFCPCILLALEGHSQGYFSKSVYVLSSELN